MKEYEYEKWIAIAHVCNETKDIDCILQKNPVIGKTIKNIYFLSFSWCNDSYDIRRSCAAWHYEKDHDYAAYKKYSAWANIPDNFELPRRAEIYEPMVIQFTDGTSIEIMYSSYIDEEPKGFKISVNEITHYPKKEMEDNGTNIAGNILFSVCIGKKITGIEIIHCEKSIHDKMILRLSDGNGISISEDYESWDNESYNGLECVDNENKPFTITFGELKPGLILDGDELEDCF